MTDGPFPSSPPPPVNPIVTSARSWWQSWWLITALSVILIVGAAALIASTLSGDDDGDSTARDADVPGNSEPTGPSATDAADTPITPPPTDDADTPITPPPNTDDSVPPFDPPSTERPPDDPPATDPSLPTTDQVAGAPAGTRGDRLAPVGAGEIADIGDGWRLQVLGLTEDGTDLVLAENQFNDPPRAGTKYTLVDVDLGYYGLDDPSNAFVPTISGVAAASVELDKDCGVIPNDFRTFADLFSGGVLRGTICFVTTPADDGTVQLYATTGFDGPDVFLAVTTPDPGVTPMPTLVGPQPAAVSTPARLDPVAIGDPVDVGQGWTLTVTSAATDITDVVAAENQFNDPPPDGFRYVGVGVAYQFDGDGAANAFEVGTKIVGDGNVEVAKGCGVIPDPVDTFADVFSGGTIDGNLCFVAPIENIGTLTLYASTEFGQAPIFFSTGGSGNSLG